MAMGFADAVRAHKAKAMARADQIVRETMETWAENLVGVGQFNGPWTPLGDPDSWKSPPPAGYQPGNLRSSWFFSVGQPSFETTTDTVGRAVKGMDLTAVKAGGRFFFTNSAPHAGAVQAGHSVRQAPAGILVNAAEFVPMVTTIARRVAGS